MFIGDGAKLVRDAFALAKEKAPAIIFIDELDAIGTKRFDSEKAGDREVQRTMLELLNQLDGFSSHADIKASSCFLQISWCLQTCNLRYNSSSCLTYCRWSLQRIVSTFWIPLCSVRVGWTARSSFRRPTKMRAHASCRFIRVKWMFGKQHCIHCVFMYFDHIISMILFL